MYGILRGIDVKRVVGPATLLDVSIEIEGDLDPSFIRSSRPGETMVVLPAKRIEPADRPKDPIPTQVFYNGLVTVCKFSDGEVITAKPTVGDLWSKEEGVKACIMRRIFGSRSAFKRLVEEGQDQADKMTQFTRLCWNMTMRSL